MLLQLCALVGALWRLLCRGCAHVGAGVVQRLAHGYSGYSRRACGLHHGAGMLRALLEGSHSILHLEVSCAGQTTSMQIEILCPIHECSHAVTVKARCGHTAQKYLFYGAYKDGVTYLKVFSSPSDAS